MGKGSEKGERQGSLEARASERMGVVGGLYRRSPLRARAGLLGVGTLPISSAVVREQAISARARADMDIRPMDRRASSTSARGALSRVLPSGRPLRRRYRALDRQSPNPSEPVGASSPDDLTLHQEEFRYDRASRCIRADVGRL